MKINGILETNWALKTGVLPDLFKIYSAHMRGDKIDWKAIKAELSQFKAAVMPGDMPQMPCKPYDIQGGVAIIPIQGVMMKNMDIWTWLFGGCSTVDISAQITDACNNREVKSIVLAFDTPGGMISGLDGLISTVAKCDKKIVSYIDSTMASAGVWVGMNADEVIAGSDTCMIGSIGIVTSHTDISGAETMAGLKTTELAVPSGKRVASEYAPLTEAGKNSIMANITALYDLFAADVAKNRKMSIEDITNLDGKMMLASEAIAVGLCDKIMPMDELIKSLQGGDSAGQGGVPVAAVVETKTKNKEVKTKMEGLTVDKLKAEFPEIYNAIKAEGIKAENARVAAIKALPVRGHSGIVEAALADPNMDANSVAMAVLKADFLAQETIKANLNNPADYKPVPAAAAPADEGSNKSYAQDAEGWKAEFADKPELKAEFGSADVYIAYMEANSKGLILSKGRNN